MSDINDEYLSLALKLQQVSPTTTHNAVVRVVRELILANRKLQRLAENDCNQGNTEHERRVAAAVENRLREILEPLGIMPIIGGDPRGCVLKLQMPDGSTNDFARTGWCVPI